MIQGNLAGCRFWLAGDPNFHLPGKTSTTAVILLDTLNKVPEGNSTVRPKEWLNPWMRNIAGNCRLFRFREIKKFEKTSFQSVVLKNWTK